MDKPTPYAKAASACSGAPLGAIVILPATMGTKAMPSCSLRGFAVEGSVADASTAGAALLSALLSSEAGAGAAADSLAGGASAGAADAGSWARAVPASARRVKPRSVLVVRIAVLPFAGRV